MMLLILGTLTCPIPGSSLPSGVYFCCLKAEGRAETIKLVVSN